MTLFSDVIEIVKDFLQTSALYTKSKLSYIAINIHCSYVPVVKSEKFQYSPNIPALKLKLKEKFFFIVYNISEYILNYVNCLQIPIILYGESLRRNMQMQEDFFCIQNRHVKK